MKICVALGNRSIESCHAALKQYSFCELRLDLLDHKNQVEELIQAGTETVVTYRPKVGEANQDTEVRMRTLIAAIRAGANYVDVELEASPDYRDKIIAEANKSKTVVIISYHNFELTPDEPELNRIVESCYEAGAAIAKVVTYINQPTDAVKILSLLKDDRPKLVLGMGEQGKIVRIAAPLLGSVFAFAAPDDGNGTAPGQMTFSGTQSLLFALKGRSR